MLIRFKGMAVEYGLTWKKLNFRFSKRGLVLLRGDNASGKTNIRELLVYVFYNKTEKSGKNNDIINRVAGKNLRIMVELDREEPDGWVGYTVLLTRKISGEPTGIRIWRGKEEDPITPTAKPAAAQKMAADLLCMSYDEFQAVVSLGQEAVHPLIEGTDTTRAEYISRTFGLEYGHYLDATTDRLRDVRIKLAARDTHIAQLGTWEGQLQELGDRKDMAKTQKKMMERVEETDDALQDADEKIQTLDRRERKQKRRVELEAELGRSEDFGPSADLEKTISKAEKEKAEIERILSRWDRAHDLENDRNSRLEGVPAEPIKFDVADLEKAEKALYGLEIQMEAQSPLAGKGKCPTCGQSVKKIALDVDDFQKLEDQVLDMEEKVDALRKKKKKRNRQEESLLAAEKLQEKIQDTKPGVTLKKARRTHEKVKEILSEARRRYNLALRGEAQSVEMGSLPRGDWKKTHSKAMRLQEDRKELVKRDRADRDKLSLVQEALRRHQKTTDAIEGLQTKIEDAEPLAHECDLLVGLIAAFGRNGMRRDRVREILHLIAQHLHQYTSALLPRYEFKLIDNEKKTSFVSVDRKDGTEGDVRTMSKGEKKRLSIALLLTERDIRRVKANILFLDEFDGGLDLTGVDELVEILTELRSEYESIFAISHNVDVQGYEGFDREYEVTREKSYSRLKRVHRR